MLTPTQTPICLLHLCNSRLFFFFIQLKSLVFELITLPVILVSHTRYSVCAWAAEFGTALYGVQRASPYWKCTRAVCAFEM